VLRKVKDQITRSTSSSFSLVLLLSFLFQTQETLFGTWRLDSASGPSAYSRVTCKIEPWQDGLRVIYDMVGTRGGVTHWEWSGKLDGKDYPLQGVEEVITNAYTRIDERTYGVAFKVDGRTTTTTKIAISPDGKTMTVTSSSANAQGQAVTNTAIYKKAR
jgi:hypothetical protein